mmetsp:Transcript_1856/g.3879  ORF Transcript_1856/g.3879 Transcript_1856/m.3879 type:complete len:553 (-) Transcript_1856:375-2033(-)
MHTHTHTHTHTHMHATIACYHRTKHIDHQNGKNGKGKNKTDSCLFPSFIHAEALAIYQKYRRTIFLLPFPLTPVVCLSIDVRQVGVSLLEVSLHCAPNGGHIDEKRVVTVLRVQFVVHNMTVADCPQDVRHLFLLPDRKENIRGDTHDQRRHLYSLHALLKGRHPLFGCRLFEGEQIHCLGDDEHGVRVVLEAPLPSLVFQVPLNDEVGIQRRGGRPPLTPESLFPLRTAPIRDGPDAPCQLHAPPREGLPVVSPSVKVRVCHQDLSLDISQSDGHRVALYTGGYRNDSADPVGVQGGSAQTLHSSQRGANNSMETVDSQVVQQCEVHPHHVLHREEREIESVGFVCCRIDGGGPGAASTSSQVVHTNDEEVVRVKCRARPNEILPPSGFRVFRVGPRMTRGRQSAREKNDVVSLLVHRPPGLVRNVQFGQDTSKLNLERYTVVVYLAALHVIHVRRLGTEKERARFLRPRCCYVHSGGVGGCCWAPVLLVHFLCGSGGGGCETLLLLPELAPSRRGRETGCAPPSWFPRLCEEGPPMAMTAPRRCRGCRGG